jgi:hypothetical protein
MKHEAFPEVVGHLSPYVSQCREECESAGRVLLGWSSKAPCDVASNSR